MTQETMNTIERALILGTWIEPTAGLSSTTTDLAKGVIGCNFKEALTSGPARALFRPLAELDRPYNEIFDFNREIGNDIDAELVRLLLAVACLHAFVQTNWTGPDLDVKPLELFPIDSDLQKTWTEDDLTTKAISELAYGGEPAYHLAKVPLLLRLSQLLLDTPFNHLKTVPWWRLRATLVHQRVLDEPAVLQTSLRSSMHDLRSALVSDPELLGRLDLEVGLLEHLLAQDKLAGEDFIRAARSTGLEYELTGALGKRTKFQMNELSQLVLLAESKLSGVKEDVKEIRQDLTPNSDTHNTSTIPETLPLNDDTLLEQTEFTSSNPDETGSRLKHIDPSSQPPLHPLDQCILLSLCLNIRNTSPSHGLTAEQMSPYVSRVILHPRNWSVHTMALLLRSRLESNRTRTVERSTFQLQALIDQMPTADSTTAERLRYFHSIPLPSRWEMEKELAQRYLSLGVIKSALEIYERLEMWENVVKCYGSLEKPEKGISIVQDLLHGRKEEADAVISRGKASSDRYRTVQDATREAKLWCLLGDLEPANAEAHYQKAWDISKQTSGRAARSLGGWYFAREKYEKSVEYLQKAVKINPLLTRSWFILGCACMRLEDWGRARDAFSRCVAIDEEDGESWNNLASMYLRIGGNVNQASNGATQSEVPEDDKADGAHQVDGPSDEVPFENKLLAFRALKQGLKFSYENWRMWYNYMIVSMDVGELQEACRALGRIVEQTAEKSKNLLVDEDVLERLVRAVIRAPAAPEDAATAAEGDEGQNPNEGHGLHKNVLALFERTILPRLSSPRIFRAYARLLSWQNRWEEAIKAYLDAYRSSTAGTIEKGESDTEKWRGAVVEVEEIVDVLRNFGPRVEGYKWRLQGRSIVRTFIGRTRDFEDEPEWERLVALQDDLRKEED